MTKRINIEREDLKNYYLNQSKLIDSDKKSSSEIIEDEGYNVTELKSEGLNLIASLRTKARPENSLKMGWEEILSKIVKAGIPRKFVESKIIPNGLLKSLKGNFDDESTQLAIDYLVTVFGLNRKHLIESESLSLSPTPSQLAFYKKPGNANLNQIKAYSHYAHFIAKASSKACHKLPFKDYPENIDEFRQLILKKYGEISLEALLETVWDLGICVIPLTDSGMFHGASWNIDGRHIIILKQKTDSHAKWIFDLLHELYHVFAHLGEDNTSVIEETELSPVASNDSEEELEANTFANQFIFHSRAEILAKECVFRAGNRTENLKQAVIDTAEESGVRVDFLANYLAFRLQHNGKNWWGTANSLQIKDPSPIRLTKEFLVKKLDFKNLNQIESNMLAMAIN